MELKIEVATFSLSFFTCVRTRPFSFSFVITKLTVSSNQMSCLSYASSHEINCLIKHHQIWNFVEHSYSTYLYNILFEHYNYPTLMLEFYIVVEELIGPYIIPHHKKELVHNSRK